MNKQETLDFVKQWNIANNFSNEISEEPNMRYVEDGVVIWNEYDSPSINIEQIIKIYNNIKENRNCACAYHDSEGKCTETPN